MLPIVKPFRFVMVPVYDRGYELIRGRTSPELLWGITSVVGLALSNWHEFCQVPHWQGGYSSASTKDKGQRCSRRPRMRDSVASPRLLLEVTTPPTRPSRLVMSAGVARFRKRASFPLFIPVDNRVGCAELRREEHLVPIVRATPNVACVKAILHISNR